LREARVIKLGQNLSIFSVWLKLGLQHPDQFRGGDVSARALRCRGMASSKYKQISGYDDTGRSKKAFGNVKAVQ
jgi:hypothetical protein